jgi:tetratricopeptide (TPR) repeat protein
MPPALERAESNACTSAARWVSVQASPVLLRWYVWTGRWTEAVRIWIDVLGESGNPTDRVTAAEAYWQVGDTKSALREWARAEGVPWIISSAAALLSQGRLTEASALAGIAIQVAPDNGETYRILAYTFWTSSDLESFQKWGKEALRREGISRVDRLMLTGQIAAVEGNWPTAAQTFALLSDLQPGRPDVLEYRGLAALRSGELQQAVDFLLQANQINAPGFWRSLYLGQAYAALGQWPAAIEWYEQAVQLDPTNRQALEGLQAAQQGHLP